MGSWTPCGKRSTPSAASRIGEGLAEIDEPSAEVISRIRPIVDETMAPRSLAEKMRFMDCRDAMLIDYDLRLHFAGVEGGDGDMVPAV